MSRDSVPQPKFWIYELDKLNYAVYCLSDSISAWSGQKEVITRVEHVDVDTATERIFNDTGRVSESYADKATARQEIIDRRKSELLRYKSFYGCDVTDFNNFDLIVDTSYASKDEINELVYQCFTAGKRSRRR